MIGRRIAVVLFFACAAGAMGFGNGPEPEATPEGFPKFITPNDEYFVTRIGRVPEVDSKTFRLEISGLVSQPTSFSLDELYAMELVELPLTIECIGNSVGGPLLSTAIWKGIRLEDLLARAGASESATGVRYTAADGYYASHTMRQIRENGVLVALYMNGVPIPPLHGFPVRVLNPGYYGVKQPAWVVRIEVIDRPLEDYWNDRGWDVSPPMAIDSTIFTPDSPATVDRGESLRITGAAFGGRRVAKVEITSDRGETWIEAPIVKRLDADHTWVFWEIALAFDERGSYLVNVRATDVDGNTQIANDPDRLDGTSDWPLLRVTVR